MRSGFVRLRVRMTTRERRRASTGFPGAVAVARASMMGWLELRSGVLCGVSRYFPAARTQLSEMKVYRYMH